MKTAREKILSTASKLFYRRGINSVGVDEIVRRSGVTKMTLYKHFPSKDILATNCLGEIHQQWSSWFLKRVQVRGATAKTSEERILVIFDVLEEWFQTPGFRGCPFINTVAEIGERNHPARKAAVAFKQRLLDTIEETLSSVGGNHTNLLGVQLLMLVDGAIVRAVMTDSSRPANIAGNAARLLLQSFFPKSTR
ncbi:TetR/AcrR family transcriptional regulator [bacterium]|nr:TetR/AcrR family transcriptional regulator [bacterium]